MPFAAGRGNGKAFDVEATFDIGSAKRFGLKVRSGANGEETIIGYDVAAQEMYVDRTRSGATTFSTEFASVERAPLKAKDGKVTLRALVDWSSVEVFGGDGEAVITDQVFPDPSSEGVQLFAEGGSARLDVAKLWRLGPYRE